MGMDVYGVNATSEKGEYFRNNVWWWRPLWAFCYENYEIARKVENGHSNDGDGLDETDSKVLGQLLLNDIADGTVADYERAYNAQLAELDREHCEYCNGTGIRKDEVGNDMGYATEELSPEIAILTGRTHGSCNACSGVGTKENFAMNYPFSAENVKAFAEFLLECGGFQIC